MAYLTRLPDEDTTSDEDEAASQWAQEEDDTDSSDLAFVATEDLIFIRKF